MVSLGDVHFIYVLLFAYIVFDKLVRYLRAFIGVETAALTFITKQYSTSNSSHICHGKRFCNEFFLNHNTIALVHNCLRNNSAVWSLKLLWMDEKESIALNSLLSIRKRSI